MNGWMAERWGLLDDKGNPTGKTMLRGERLKPGAWYTAEELLCALN